MRTTLTLDDDVTRLLEEETRRSGESFKAVVNRYLRLGMVAAQTQVAKPFTVAPRNLGLPQGLSYDNVEQLLETLEGSAHR